MAEPQFAYPIMLSLEGRPVVVIGGGKVALRKAQALADAGAHVYVVAPSLLPEFASDARLRCIAEPYAAKHLAGAFLVIAATDDEAVNARVAADARAAGVLVNVVDRPALCDFIVPATVNRGRLVIAISSGGAAPSLARRLRERLEREFGEEFALYLDVMNDVRREILSRGLPEDVRRRIFERLSEDDVLAAAREGKEELRRKVNGAINEAIP